MQGSYPQIYDAAARYFKDSPWLKVTYGDRWICVEEPRDLFATALYFYPEVGEGRTIVESLYRPDASGTYEQCRVMELSFLDGIASLLRRTRRCEEAPGALRPARSGPPMVFSDVDVLEEMRAPLRPDHFAIIVGINRYRDLQDADFADHDARIFEKYARNVLGVPKANVALLLDEKAAKADLEKYLGEWLPRNTEHAARLYFFFAGHGATDPAAQKSYLVPWDGDPAYLASSGLSTDELFTKLLASGAREVIAFLDSCFSGAGGRSVAPRGVRPLLPTLPLAPPMPARLSVMTAASSGEITASLQDRGHGLFTYHLLKGLQGAAPARSGHLGMQALFSYAREEVQSAARLENRKQTPQLFGPNDPKLY